MFLACISRLFKILKSNFNEKQWKAKPISQLILAQPFSFLCGDGNNERLKVLPERKIFPRLVCFIKNYFIL